MGAAQDVALHGTVSLCWHPAFVRRATSCSLAMPPPALNPLLCLHQDQGANGCAALAKVTGGTCLVRLAVGFIAGGGSLRRALSAVRLGLTIAPYMVIPQGPHGTCPMHESELMHPMDNAPKLGAICTTPYIRIMAKQGRAA